MINNDSFRNDFSRSGFACIFSINSRDSLDERKLCSEILRIIRILAPDESKRPRIKRVAFGWWLRRLTPLVLNGTLLPSLYLFLSLSFSHPLFSPPSSSSLSLFFLSSSNFLSLASFALACSSSLNTRVRRGWADDVSRLSKAGNFWNWLLTSRIDFHSLTPSSAPRHVLRILRSFRGIFHTSADHNFCPLTSSRW